MKGKRAFRFDLIDRYESDFRLLIVSSDDMEEIKKAAKRHIEATDGECSLVVADWDNKTIKDL